MKNNLILISILLLSSVSIEKRNFKPSTPENSSSTNKTSQNTENTCTINSR